MSLIKNAMDFFKKGDDDTERPAEEKQPVLAHPDLKANDYYALPNDYCPVVVSSQGISCRIEYKSHGEYFVVTRSKGRIMVQESLNARDRKKLFVTGFDFKGLIGIHLHPAGMVLTLDEEKNAKGEPRTNQPPATIVSGPLPPHDEQLKNGRILRIDLTTLSEGTPLLISSNNRLLHMMIKPLGSDNEAWGLQLSNANGIVRANGAPSLVLQREGRVWFDRNLLIRLAASPEESITARTWNMETVDPILMQLAVDAEGVLTLEELFTTHGLSVVAGEGQPTSLGLLGDSPSPRDAELRRQHAETLGKLRDRTRSCVAEQGQEERLQGIRDHLLADVARALRKEAPGGVVMLALELAVKEIIAPRYNDASGSDHITTVDHTMVTLLNAIVSELTGWIQTDSSTALSAAAIDQVIGEIAHTLPMQGLDAMMRQELPKNRVLSLEEEQIHFEDLRQNAKQFLSRFLTASAVSRDVHHLARQIAKSSSEEEQKELRVGLGQAVKKMMRETMIQTLVRLSVRGHLIRIEREKREELGIVLQNPEQQPVTTSDLDDIIKRYNEYALYIAPAFQERLRAPLNSVIKDFQDGAVKQQRVTLNTNGFVSYMVVLRQSGGKLDTAANTTVPAITCLHSLPDAIPDIHVEQPVREVAKGFVRVVHREGQLMEADFAITIKTSTIPPGVPEGVWFAFQDFAVRFIEHHLTTGQKAEHKQQQELIARQFAHRLLLKVVNLFRGLQSIPSSASLADVQEFLGTTHAVAEARFGESQGEELLDVQTRPSGMTESAMNLKHELRQVVVALQKDAGISTEIFRFKQRMSSFAGAGGGPRRVSLPITVSARQGIFTLEALFDETPFKKVIHLTGGGGETTEEPVEERPAAAAQKKDPNAQERARIQAVRERTEKLSRQGIAQLLDGLEFFKDFSTYEKDRVAALDVGFRLTKRQEVLIRENTTDTAFFILIKGRVAAIKGALNGSNDKVLFTLEAGEIIGEMAFLTGTPRTLNIVAQENGLLLRVDSELLGRLSCDSREKFKDQIISKLAGRLADTTNRLRKTTPGESPLKTAREKVPGHQGELKQISREETIERIERIAFFDPFTPFEKRRITAFNTSFYTYPAGTFVIREGEVDTAFFILIDGTVAVIKGENEIVDFGPGEFFGDMAFLTSQPRSTGVRSKTEILVLRVDQELLKRLGAEIREKIKDRLIRTLCARLIQTTGRMT
ncbi:MAG: cyclic nucleotide-binding domain-containing protein [Magnetococcus sp. MYC-9]